MDREQATTVTVYASWRGIVASFLTPLVLLAIGGSSVLAVGARVVPVAVTATGAGLLLVALFDVPLHTRLDDDGIHRACLLRRHHLVWERVRLVQRARGNLTSYARVKGMPGEQTPSGGLVAVVGRRRYQLTDRIESRSEYDMVRDVVRRREGDVEVTAVRPSAKSPPTTLYRRGVPNPPPPFDA